MLQCNRSNFIIFYCTKNYNAECNCKSFADARSSGQQSGVKHGGGIQQSKYSGQTGSYGGGWA